MLLRGPSHVLLMKWLLGFIRNTKLLEGITISHYNVLLSLYDIV